MIELNGGFLKEVMLRMGFTKEWVALIMRCISIVSYVVNINGRRGNIFKPTRGLRQGDPLSPFLFLICNDCILFGEATNRGAMILKEILKEYERCSGQCLKHSRGGERRNLDFIRCEQLKKFGKSLGLPNVVGRRKKESFQNLKDRVYLRIERWSTRLLSQGGKEVFIKSVLQAIPTYAMSCFLLPKSLCGELENIFANFWWQKG
ncbi:reverse transcriptase [Gossypium australe]|uniref:Reverse transcriptase n=1 Tax=Gossypium australe TaxID=47621 RepID=A0A5B6VES4_9ROSI|nr:reverse transcriptase [Gossypium australe]